MNFEGSLDSMFLMFLMVCLESNIGCNDCNEPKLLPGGSLQGLEQ